MSRPFKIFTARSSRKIALAICEAYGTELGDENVIEFSDGEFEPSFNESIRGAVYNLHRKGTIRFYSIIRIPFTNNIAFSYFSRFF